MIIEKDAILKQNPIVKRKTFLVITKILQRLLSLRDKKIGAITLAPIESL